MPPRCRHESGAGPETALALTLLLSLIGAASAHAQAASPFPEVPLAEPERRSHVGAYVAMASGAALIGSSFLFDRRADRAYDEYLTATDPGTLERLYDRSVLYDRLASGALVAGEGLVAGGLYLRFLRRPPPSRAGLAFAPGRLAWTWAF